MYSYLISALLKNEMIDGREEKGGKWGRMGEESQRGRVVVTRGLGGKKEEKRYE